MREEYIDYKEDLPVDIYLAEVKNYPLHWHDATEIVLVLEGEIDIEIGTDVYHIGPGEIEIVNHNEVHSIKSKGQNRLLILNIDPDFFERYYEGAREVFFYADSSNREAQEFDRYVDLRTYISILFYEFTLRYEDSKDLIEEKLLAMMYHLLNNFHYLYYEEESLREDELELERYHRIVRYISKNYMNRISLQEIADQEFLTSQYLSFKIKNTFGYGFNDFLNLTRVEESLKLLLNTDKNISEISEDVGFSHVRYYNKHFRLHYNMSPMEYRKEFQLGEEELERLTQLEVRPLEEALDYLRPYLESYERYDYDDRIYKYEIDLAKEVQGTFSQPEILRLGGLGARSNLGGDLAGLGFKYGLLEDLDSYLGSPPEGEQNFQKLEGMVDLVYDLGLRPLFLVDGWEGVLEDFGNYLRVYRPDLEEVHLIRGEELWKKARPLYGEGQAGNDGLYRLGDILRGSLEERMPLPKLMDDYSFSLDGSDSFTGGDGMITYNGLKKASFYAYDFIGQLGPGLLYREEGLVVTKSEDGFQVLVFDPLDPREREGKAHLGQKKKYSLNILNMGEDYRVVRYEINQDSGSAYDKWVYLGRPRILSRSYLDLLRSSSRPDVKFYYAQEQTVYNIVGQVRDRGANLYVFEKVELKDY